MKPVPFYLVYLSFLIALLTPAALAVAVVPLDLTQLVEASDEIVHGTVTAVVSHWNEDHTQIVTDVHVGVHEALLGESQDEVVFVHPGGVVGALRVEVAGAGAFRTDQEVVLFLSPDGQGQRRITGLTQGRFDVEVEATPAARKVVRTVTERGPADSGDGLVRPAAARPPEGEVERLEAFLIRVRVIVVKVEREEERR